MYYITVRQSPAYHQMSLEEFLFGDGQQQLISLNQTNTKTYEVERVSDRFLETIDKRALVGKLLEFNAQTKALRDVEREELYDTFYVPKKGKNISYIFKQIFALQNRYINCQNKDVFRQVASAIRSLTTQHPTIDNERVLYSVIKKCTSVLMENGFEITEDQLKEIICGALRRIDAPKAELKTALANLKMIFEEDFKALYHTTAFAYVKNRSILDCLKRHQANDSKWYEKLDLHNFFGSTTPEFVYKQFGMIFPFCEIFKDTTGKKELETALELAFLNGGLPQGTPISPTITNIMMIPIDFKLSKALRDFNGQRFINTRYADDFQISSKYTFDYREVETLVVDVLAEFDAPFKINESKTRYGSRAGRNFNLGLMVNKDNQITVGHEKKRKFKAMLTSYILDKRNGNGWDRSDVQVMEGLRSYYRSIEKKTVDAIVERINQKFDVNVEKMIKADIKA